MSADQVVTAAVITFSSAAQSGCLDHFHTWPAHSNSYHVTPNQSAMTSRFALDNSYVDSHTHLLALSIAHTSLNSIVYLSMRQTYSCLKPPGTRPSSATALPTWSDAGRFERKQTTHCLGAYFLYPSHKNTSLMSGQRYITLGRRECCSSTLLSTSSKMILAPHAP
jgi:hypothetical protein